MPLSQAKGRESSVKEAFSREKLGNYLVFYLASDISFREHHTCVHTFKSNLVRILVHTFIPHPLYTSSASSRTFSIGFFSNGVWSRLVRSDGLKVLPLYCTSSIIVCKLFQTKSPSD